MTDWKFEPSNVLVSPGKTLYKVRAIVEASWHKLQTTGKVGALDDSYGTHVVE